MKKYFIIVSLFLLATACNKQSSVSYYPNKQQCDDVTGKVCWPVIDGPHMGQFTASSTDYKPIVYTDSNYGFQITLPEVYKNYQIIENPCNVNSDKGVWCLDFALPTSDHNYGRGDGFASPFGIEVSPIESWPGGDHNVFPHTYITRNKKYVFGYYQWQQPPTDMINIDFKIPKIIASFKLTN